MTTPWCECDIDEDQPASTHKSYCPMYLATTAAGKWFDQAEEAKDETARLRLLVAELLDNFTPFITAWEAKDPHASDGEDLAKRMRTAIGRNPDGSDDGEPMLPARGEP